MNIIFWFWKYISIFVPPPVLWKCHFRSRQSIIWQYFVSILRTCRFRFENEPLSSYHWTVSKYIWLLYTFWPQKTTFNSLTFALEVKNITSGRIKVPFDNSLSNDSKNIWLLGTFLHQRATFSSVTFDHDVVLKVM